MSKYLELKSQMAALQAQLDAARGEETQALIADMRAQIEEFGLTPAQLFPGIVVQTKRPPKYRWEGHEWSGSGGVTPQWFRDALALGVTKEQMLISNQG